MPTLTKESAEQHLQNIERRILLDSGVSSMGWMGIEISWQRCPLKNGGYLKRNGAYGKIVYSYRDNTLTRDESLNEVSKPISLRQALIEAESSIECSMCGLIVVGKDALEPYTGITFHNGRMHHKPKWGIVFWKMIDHEPQYLNICPNCLQRIADGEFHFTKE